MKNEKGKISLASRLIRGGVSAVFTAFAMASALLPLSLSQASAASKSDKIKIMPVGDSITFGMGDTGGYRKFLDYFMKEKGYTGIDFVGPEGQNSASFNYNGKSVTYDDNHAGYSGYQIKQPASWGQDSSLYNKLKEKNAVKQAQPDVILLIIGTNDMTANRSMSDCASDLKDLVGYMLNDMPEGGKVFMGSIPEFTAYGGTDGRVTRYNNTVKEVAEELKGSGKNVEFADVHGCLNGTADLGFDGLHPNGTGYEKMGKFWAETLDDYFSGSSSSQNQQSNNQQPTQQENNNQQQNNNNQQPGNNNGSGFGISDKSQTVKIMPVGDSITFGMGETGGYRKFLDYFMKEKGYTGIDFVGPEGQNSASFNYNGKSVTYDDNHAGYSGYQIKQPASWGQDSSLYNKLKEKNAVKQAQPDIILLIIGTNDMTANRSMSDCASDLKDLVNYMLNDMPEGGIVFMGSIPEFTAYGGTDGRVTRYNNTVKEVAEELKSSGKNVEFADIHGCLNGTADLGFDGLHPNGTGYEKMGKFWAETIDEYLSSSAAVPATEPPTEAPTEAPTAPPTEPETEAPILRGDLDFNGRINAFDLVILRSCFETGFSDFSILNPADVDENGSVEMADMVLLSKFLLGQISSFK